jgi:hypothetical protein
MAIAVEILIGALMDTGVPPLLSLAAIGAIGWLLRGKLWLRPLGRASAET